MRDEDSDIRKAAARVLGKIGDERAIGPLITTLRDKYEWVREAAAKALVKIGKPAVESLIQTLRDEDPDVRWAAAYVLGNIGDLRAIEPLIQTLRDENSFVREAAVYALGKIEPEWYKTEAAGRQVPEFVKALEKAKDEEYRNYIKELLEKIFSSHKPFLHSYPYLFCKNCMLRAEKKKAKFGLFKRWSYVVCRGCGTAEALIIGIKKVVGIIGGNISNYSIDGDTAYVRLWFEKEKKARNADIDMLLIAESEDMQNENEYDKAINTVYNVLVNDRTRSKKYVRKIPVLIQRNLPLSIRAKRVLENKFGGVTHM
ncbi:MAG: HEAT repeat [Thermodesulfobacteria bacterium]|nr:HEAT repeat [Thermodesulfobacteriota bacterium]